MMCLYIREHTIKTLRLGFLREKDLRIWYLLLRRTILFNAANIKDSINYIVDRINRENPKQLDQNATAPTAR